MKSYVMGDGRWHHRLRQSWLNTALTVCPEQARLVAVEQLPPDATDAAAIGTACHAGIEANLRGDVSSYDDALPIMQEAWWAEEQRPGFKYTKHSARTAWKLIEAYYAQWYDKFDPQNRGQRGWELEQSFLYTAHEDEHRLIEISGNYDAFDGFELIDWKTSGRGPYEAREYQRWAIQPTVYTRAIQERDGINPPFKYVVMHADGLQQFTCVRDDADWSWLAEQCVSLAHLIEADLPAWPKNDQHWLCSPKWCPAYGTCKGKHRP